MIDFLRAKGVLNYSANGITLSLLPEEPPKPPPEEPKQKVEEPKRGRDGLTAEQQQSLYCWVERDLK